MSDRSTTLGPRVLLALSFMASPAFAGPNADPTRPPDFNAPTTVAADAQKEAPLELQAVFFAEGRRMAIINGERLRLDEDVQSARLVRIERDRVALRRDGKTIELELVETDVKRPIPPARIAEDGDDAPPPTVFPAAPALPGEGSQR